MTPRSCSRVKTTIAKYRTIVLQNNEKEANIKINICSTSMKQLHVYTAWRS